MLNKAGLRLKGAQRVQRDGELCAG